MIYPSIFAGLFVVSANAQFGDPWRAPVANANCPTVPGGTCTNCVVNAGDCTEVICDTHFYDYDGSAANGCEENYQIPNPACTEAFIGNQQYCGLQVNSWDSSCGHDQRNYLWDRDVCRAYATANHKEFHDETDTPAELRAKFGYVTGGCMLYVGADTDQAGIYYFGSQRMGNVVPPARDLNKSIKDFSWICTGESAAILNPEALEDFGAGCCPSIAVATPSPTPSLTPSPVPSPTQPPHEECPFGYEEAVGFSRDRTVAFNVVNVGECADKCDENATPGGDMRLCQSFQFNARLGLCNLFASGAPNDNTAFAPGFVFCIQEDIGQVAPTPHSGDCLDFESNLVADDGVTCMGVQSFKSTADCPEDFPTPLTEAECTSFGSVTRTSWSIRKHPAFIGSLSTPSLPFGCVEANNYYIWNSRESNPAIVSDFWGVTCKREPIAVDCGILTRRNECRREGGCVWWNASSVCVNEHNAQTECDWFTRQKCHDASDRCVWGNRVGMGSTCVDLTTITCSTLSRSQCNKVHPHCAWRNGACH